MRSSLSPYVLKTSVNNSRNTNGQQHSGGVSFSYRQSDIDAKLEKLSDFIRQSISDKTTIDIGLALVEDTRESFQRTLRDNKLSSSSFSSSYANDKENASNSSNNKDVFIESYLHEMKNSSLSPSKEHFQSLTSRESMVSLISRPSVGETVATATTIHNNNKNTDDAITPLTTTITTVDRSNTQVLSTVTRRSKRNKNGNLVSASKVTFADITSPVNSSSSSSAIYQQEQKSAKSAKSVRFKQAYSPAAASTCNELDVTLKLDPFNADSFSQGRSSVFSTTSALDTTLVYDPSIEDGSDEVSLLSPHRSGLLDRTMMLELSAERDESPRESSTASSFVMSDQPYYHLSTFPIEDEQIQNAPEPQLNLQLPSQSSAQLVSEEEESSSTPFKVVKRGRKGRKSVSGHIFKLERFRDEEPDELDNVKSAMENMSLGPYQDETINIVGIPFSSQTSIIGSNHSEPKHSNNPTDAMQMAYSPSPKKSPDQPDNLSPGIAARRPSRRASVQCKEKLLETDNGKDKRPKKVKPFESKPIERVVSVYQSLATLKASLADTSFLRLEELSIESYLEARSRVEASMTSHKLSSDTTSDSSALALLLAISDIPEDYPQPVFEYLAMLPGLMRPAPCESIVNHHTESVVNYSKGKIKVFLLH